MPFSPNVVVAVFLSLEKRLLLLVRCSCSAARSRRLSCRISVASTRLRVSLCVCVEHARAGFEFLSGFFWAKNITTKYSFRSSNKVFQVGEIFV